MSDLPEYTVRVSKRARRPRLRVTPAGKVEVVVPRGFPRREIPALVAARQDWLAEALARVEASRPEGSDLRARWPERVRLPALPAEWPVEYARPGKGGCQAREVERGDRLRVRAADPAGVRQALGRWLDRKARDELVPWLEAVAAEQGASVAKVSVRNAATRWGSCSSRGGISLNRNLLFLEPAVVRYLMIHELCHLERPDHSAAFWQGVAAREPDYRELDRRLRQGLDEVPLWALPDRLLPENFFVSG